MIRESAHNVHITNVDGMHLTCPNQVCKHQWIYKGHAKFYAQCPNCMRKVKLPGTGQSPQEAAHEDLKHISPRKGDISQQMFRDLYSVARQMASDKHEALRMARAAFKEKYRHEPEYEKKYWQQ
jgi:hypothetical protein